MVARSFATLGGKEGKRGEEALGEIESHLVAGMLREGMEEARGRRIAQHVVERLTIDFGGARIYIPNVRSKRVQARNRAIIEAYDGANMGELARQFDLSEERVRQIIRAEDARLKVRGQGHA